MRTTRGAGSCRVSWTAYERVRGAILEDVKSPEDSLADDAVFSTSYGIWEALTRALLLKQKESICIARWNVRLNSGFRREPSSPGSCRFSCRHGLSVVEIPIPTGKGALELGYGRDVRLRSRVSSEDAHNCWPHTAN